MKNVNDNSTGKSVNLPSGIDKESDLTPPAKNSRGVDYGALTAAALNRAFAASGPKGQCKPDLPDEGSPTADEAAEPGHGPANEDRAKR